jgi:ADP-ribose pyrophosphatase
MKVDIGEKKMIFNDFFKIEEVHLQFERYDGSMSPLVRRLNFERGNSVAALVFDAENQGFIFVEQFRYPSYTRGKGWLMELVAGGVSDGENPEFAILREIEEEIGYRPEKVELIAEFFSSPGGSSEKVFLYFCEVSSEHKISQGGGLESESEDIKKIFLTVPQSYAKLRNFEFLDAKIIIALQWYFSKYDTKNPNNL